MIQPGGLDPRFLTFCLSDMQKKQRDDDLFKETTMTFGEHLEELRSCLAKAVAGLVICTIGGLFFGDVVIDLIKRPLVRALSGFYMTKCELDYNAWADEREARELSIPYSREAVKKLIQEHRFVVQIELVDPRQLRLALPAGTVAPEKPKEAGVHGNGAAAGGSGDDALAGAAAPVPARSAEADDEGAPAGESLPTGGAPLEELTPENLQPLIKFWPMRDDPRIDPTTLSAQEAFMFWMKAGLVIGLLASSPWVFYQLWMFVAAGLYPHERRYIYIYLPFSLGLFFAGALLAYLFVFDPVLDFLFDFNRRLGLGPEPRISEWLNFVLFLPLGFGVSFQLPLVMLFLNRIGVLSVEVYKANWRISFLAIVILAAVLTPADPVSMPLMAGPLCLLYLLGIALCKYMPRGRNLLDG